MSLHMLAPKTEAETALARQFAGLAASPARRAAFAAFEARGLPSRRDEAWHYTDLRSRLKTVAPLAPAPDATRLAAARAQAAAIPRVGAIRLVWVDGRYAAALTDPAPEGLTVTEGRDASFEAADAVVALNAAFAEGALRLAAAPGAALSLEILRLDGPGAIFARVELTIGAGANVAVFERFDGATEETQRNVVSRIDVGEAARCDWTTLAGDAAALHLEAPIARLAANAAFINFGLVCGPALARRQIEVVHEAPGAKIALSGLTLIDSERHADTTLNVRHAAPRGESREYYRHIVADQASGVYQGKVIVAPHAQKTDGGMKSQALLLSPTASMNNKPELEIFADDVVCGHGATVGALDPEPIFYLRSRGLPKAEAEAMLLEAFGVEAIERVADASAAEALRDRLRLWLKERAA